MTLHVNRSTVGHDAPLAPLHPDAEAAASRRRQGAQEATGGDSVALSGSARKLAGMDRGEEAQLRAVDQADALVRQLLARAAQDPQGLRAAQAAPDASRVAQLLQG